MTNLLALFLIIVFLLLGLVHLYWALGNREGWLAVIPEVDGKLAFEPSTAMVYFVSISLFLCAILVGLHAGFLSSVFISLAVIRWLMYALAFGLFLRAVGDFKFVGFFKRIRDTQFARLDSRFYSPFCLILSLGVLVVTLG